MTGYEERRDAFATQGVNIIAGVVDNEEKTLVVAEKLGFPVAYGVTKEQADLLGSWWEKRNFMQPSEFVLAKDGTVMMSTYSNSPIGRMDPAEALTLITFINENRKKK